ncbi:MAG: YtxH domain-containing protein [Candidatus Limnocylindria bacterium]
MGVVFAFLAGAVAALLYGPKLLGNSPRDQLQLRADELKKRADDLQRIAQKIADDVSVKGREIIQDAKKEWETTGGSRSSGTTGTTGSKSG